MSPSLVLPAAQTESGMHACMLRADIPQQRKYFRTTIYAEVMLMQESQEVQTVLQQAECDSIPVFLLFLAEEALVSAKMNTSPIRPLLYNATSLHRHRA